MMFANAVLQYYRQLTGPANLPDGVETLNPFQNELTLSLCEQFYHKYYEDENDRIMLFGINPGRFGAGLTGIPFTDPIALETECDIANPLDKRAELSSKFIYDMIRAYGGPEPFYRKYYISAVSPLGYVRDGINLNYYDLKGFKPMFEQYVVKEIRAQLPFGIDTSKAYSIGKGQNVKYLNYINDKYHFFDEIIPLPHPRWVMQYRLRRKEEFIKEYVEKLR